jgi:cytidyltransferase-like protein
METLEDLLNDIDLKGKSKGLCHGVFDVIHAGHIDHFRQAKEKVDFLFVSITSRGKVTKLRGEPFFDDEKRKKVLEAIKFIDYVIISDYEGAVEVISIIKPKYYFKGIDYKNSLEEDSKLNLEKTEVEKWGGELCFTKSSKLSTSSILDSLATPLSPEFTNWAKSNLHVGDIERLWNIFDTPMKVHVSVVGDFIIDRYVKCLARGKSSKEPNLVFEELDSINLIGGAGAIARNASNLCEEVTLETFMDEESKNTYFKENKSIKVLVRKPSEESNRFMIKTRFIDQITESKLFLKYDWKTSEINSEVKSNKKCEILAIADYGHGLLSNFDIIELINTNEKVIINSQLNSANRMPHKLETYANCFALVLNRAELLWHYDGIKKVFEDICKEFIERVKCKYLVVTLGSDGVLVMDHDGKYVTIPALKNYARDRVGAGDSLFLLVALSMNFNLDSKQIGLLANIGGAINMQFLGNERSLSRADVQLMLETILAGVKY